MNPILAVQLLDEIDITTVLAVGGFILGAASGIAQIVKIVKDANRIPIQNKLDESAYAKNALEAANLATEARLRLEAHALDLEKRIDELDTTMTRLEKDIVILDKKNKKLIKVVDELLKGIELLVEQLKVANVKPAWIPSETLKDVVKASMGIKSTEEGEE